MSNPRLADDAPRVVIETSMGDIVVGLYAEQSPLTVNNFLEYVDAGFYGGTVFHRVMPNFMIQGGGFARAGADLQKKDTSPPIELESDNGIKNVRGTIAMARTPALDSATSQFFVNLVDNQRLDRLGDVEPGYTAFGVVLEGMDIVDAIGAVETHFVSQFNAPTVPVEDVVIRSIRRQ